MRNSGHWRAGLRGRVGAAAARRSARRKLLIALGVGAFATPLASFAQQQPKKASFPRIGFLSAASPSANLTRIEAFRQGLRELGYVEGKNIVIEYRYAEGKLDRVSELAAELVRLKVDVIVTGGPAATRSAKEATVTLPIVMAFDDDPVGAGFVASLARPGGNITGLATLYPEISGKRLELLKEIVPKLARVAVLGNSTEPGNAQALREVQAAGGMLGIKILSVGAHTSQEIERGLATMIRERADAFIVVTDALFLVQRARIADLAVKHRLPWIVGQHEYVEAGGLMSYGQNAADFFRRAATYVDKILKGARPRDLPVEQPTRFELVINRKTANALGLTIPQSLLISADRVIE